MANTNLTHQMIAREAASMLEEMATFTMGINRGRESEFGVATNGYKKGDTVKVFIPPTPKVYSGATYAEGGTPADNVEQYVNLSLDTQKHTALRFGAKEKLLEMTDFKERYLRPAMNALVSNVESDLIQKATLSTPNLVGSAGSVPTDLEVYGNARSKLNQFLAPTDKRYGMLSSDASVKFIKAASGAFNDSRSISKQYKEGEIGRYSGIEWSESQSLYTHTLGNKVSGVQVNGAGQTGSALNIKGLTAADTITKGSVFTMVIKAIHPVSGAAYSFAQQFVVTSDFTATGATGTINIYPSIDAAMPNATVSASPSDSAALTFVGSASTAYRQDLVWQEGAFTAAFAPLPVLAGMEGYTATLPNGISVRVQTGGSFDNDREDTRIDILYGFQTVRGLHACRVTE